MIFGEGCFSPLEREKAITLFLLKPTLWSAKIVVRVIGQKILGV